jgi:hypothetical protein
LRHRGLKRPTSRPSTTEIVKVEAVHSDGSEIAAVPLNEKFNEGLFVVMSDDRTFQYYKPQNILGLIGEPPLP